MAYIGINNLDGADEVYLGTDLLFKKKPDYKWLLEHTLIFTASGASTIGLTNYGSNAPVLYKSTDGVTWESWNYSAISLADGASVYIKGDNPKGFSSSDFRYSMFTMTGSIACEGNVMGLLGEDVTDIPCTYCFYRLFQNCTSLSSVPELPATTLANNCYANMFNGCASLTSAPELPATTLANNCYDSMFFGCTSLTSVPELPATTLASVCYSSMFRGCTSLTSAPELPATTLTDFCYSFMFSGCTSLTSAPALPATTLASNCYHGMFYGCTKLTSAPELPATTLANHCYNSMFYGCTSLTSAPALPATTLTSYCYNNMFRDCTKLNYIKAMFTTTPSDTYTQNWVYNVATKGTFVKDGLTTWDVTGVNSVPSGWTVKKTPLLKFTASGASTIGLTNYYSNAPVLYKSTDGVTWELWNYSTISLADGTSVYIKGDNPNGFSSSNSKYSMFTMTGSIACEGNVMSLLGENVTDIPCDYCFYKLFQNCTSLTSAPALPATTLASYCYNAMFYNCTSLTSAPALPATTLTNRCYESMFRGCTSLRNAPALPATTLASYCYYYMFSGCTSLTSAPSILPATTLTSYCYDSMFNGCTRLTSAPKLPATTLASNCYDSMFYSCRKLNYIKAMFTTTPSTAYTYNWVSGVASTGTFVKNANATWDVTGTNGVPSGWTVETEYETPLLKFTASGASTLGLTNNGGNAPVLYKSTDSVTWESWDYSTISLADGASVYIKGDNPNGFNSSTSKYSKFTMTGSIACDGNVMGLLGEDVTDIPCSYCYLYMFRGCTSLISAPALPATTLIDNCYRYMFSGCTSLTSAPALPATTLASYCYNAMFYGCTSLTSAPKLPATTLASECYSYMFYGCTKLTSAPALPATTLANWCYNAMFSGCTSLRNAPALPATTLASYCYYLMFEGCASLTSAPELSATTLADYCYQSMFKGCRSLTSAPELPATTLASGCYNGMFYGCTNLNYIKAMFTTTPSNTYTQNWVSGVASTGTFIKNANATWDVTGANGVPSGWTVETEYETPLLKFTASGASTLGLTNYGSNAPVLYKSTDSVTWETWDYSTISLTDGASAYIKGDNPNGFSSSGSKYSTFTMTGSIACEGNVMGLLGEDVTDIPCSYCFYYLFKGCTSLTSAPALPATTLANACYDSMFQNCTSLTSAPKLPATTLASYCYDYMFRGCTSLKSAPELPATTLTYGCYYGMFNGCSSLRNAPSILPATTLTNQCYVYMFRDCTSLKSAPELPATTLASECYSSMFQGCTSLKSAPELPATTLTNNCYANMFNNCRNLNYIKAMFTTTPSDTYTSNWVSGILSTGTFIKNGLATWDATGGNGVPSGWTVEKTPLLKFTASGASTLGLTNNGGNAPILYKTTDGVTWETWDYSTISLADGTSVYIKGDNPNGFNSAYSKYSTFTMTGNIACEGNVMGLLGDDVTDIPCSYCFYELFRGCTSLTSAPALPATTLVDECYYGMFYGCTSLKSAPELPATTLASGCYQYMFRDCTSLTSAPELPATTLANSCYSDMFRNCTSLTSAPELPATTLTSYCYTNMFYGCTSLISAPELPATTLAVHCYSYMFRDCTSLTSAPALPATTLVDGCYYDMFRGCTSLTNAPSILPATTLANSCYYEMFRGCTSLKSAPELSATTLANGCYLHMFNGCTKLNYIKAMFTTTPSTAYTTNWVYNVAPKGAFVKNGTATWDVTGINGVPSGWKTITNNGVTDIIAYYEIPDDLVGEELYVCGMAEVFLTAGDRDGNAFIVGDVMDNVARMKVDNVEVSVSKKYTFNTKGTHVIKYTLKDKAHIGHNVIGDPKNIGVDAEYSDVFSLFMCLLEGSEFLVGAKSAPLTAIVLPSSIERFNYYSFALCLQLTDIYITDRVWDSITKEDDWNVASENVTVHAKDGDYIDNM